MRTQARSRASPIIHGKNYATRVRPPRTRAQHMADHCTPFRLVINTVGIMCTRPPRLHFPSRSVWHMVHACARRRILLVAMHNSGMPRARKRRLQTCLIWPSACATTATTTTTFDGTITFNPATRGASICYVEHRPRSVCYLCSVCVCVCD